MIPTRFWAFKAYRDRLPFSWCDDPTPPSRHSFHDERRFIATRETELCKSRYAPTLLSGNEETKSHETPPASAGAHLSTVMQGLGTVTSIKCLQPCGHLLHSVLHPSAGKITHIVSLFKAFPTGPSRRTHPAQMQPAHSGLQPAHSRSSIFGQGGK